MLYRILRVIAFPFVHIIFRLQIKGKENIPENEGYIICANHVSIADVFALAYTFKPPIKFMAKAELMKFAPLKAFFTAMGAFPVERGKGDTGAIDKACDILNNGGVFGIFPEGTRTKDGYIGRIKSGAAVIASKTKATIIPVSLKYSTKKPKLFCKIYVNVGRPIPYQEPSSEISERGEIRNITEKIRDNITELWEMDEWK